MSYIHLSIQDALRTHKQNLAVLDQQAEEARRPANYVAEVPFEIPEEVFSEERSCPNMPCDFCDALWEADHPNCKTEPCAECREVNGLDCECGGTFDEYDACSDCAIGHDDHSIQECESCRERAVDKAEMYADMARDEEMGL